MDLFYYILAYVVLTAVTFEVIAYYPYESPNFWDYFGSVVNVAIAILGTLTLFDT